eukprot:751168-Hanusia_phi.AAC.1
MEGRRRGARARARASQEEESGFLGAKEKRAAIDVSCSAMKSISLLHPPTAQPSPSSHNPHPPVCILLPLTSSFPSHRHYPPLSSNTTWELSEQESKRARASSEETQEEEEEDEEGEEDKGLNSTRSYHPRELRLGEEDEEGYDRERITSSARGRGILIGVYRGCALGGSCELFLASRSRAYLMRMSRNRLSNS